MYDDVMSGRSAGCRILIIDTSGTYDYKLTRIFYNRLGYIQESVICGFWDEGDDKVTFWKKLN